MRWVCCAKAQGARYPASQQRHGAPAGGSVLLSHDRQRSADKLHKGSRGTCTCSQMRCQLRCQSRAALPAALPAAPRAALPVARCMLHCQLHAAPCVRGMRERAWRTGPPGHASALRDNDASCRDPWPPEVGPWGSPPRGSPAAQKAGPWKIRSTRATPFVEAPGAQRPGGPNACRVQAPGTAQTPA